ncbi:hypothetical protein RRG08_018274 [Elysia crispata]|uniref:Uncharacterized protein n=1 Tax=Elysia crispata TaxID=231223 RepID=A0AAE0ZYC7_9GAST|nr:hypothetical protein RRG08_018274 [Elysia crispata]
MRQRLTKGIVLDDIGYVSQQVKSIRDASQLTRLDLALKWKVLVESNPVVKGQIRQSNPGLIGLTTGVKSHTLETL